MDNRLRGKIASEAIRLRIKRDVELIVAKGERPPHLSAILVGNDGASQSYVNAKEKACEDVGFLSSIFRLPENTSQKELIDRIDQINENDQIDGLIVQLPLPPHIDENFINAKISPDKDVDGFHDVNMGRLAKGNAIINPATPLGILLLLEHYNLSVEGKHVVVLGRSNIVGRPLSILLSENHAFGNATVTLCHSRTKNLKEWCKKADVLIAAIGKPYFVTADMVKEGAIVIDVGTTRIDADNERGWKLAGDVNYTEVKEKVSAITPVPGGVGPMTITGLLSNTLLVRKKRLEQSTSA
ncbi:bifunctional methylenetetrahydrofolate dehydrogenase/methenyltetrahydrofolate cyclohydrolase FolD [Bacteroidia bacterium]|nr:bifunctional methylenetetrahydrofolate dehydrogenase/methenyltetrahydrofolate cyclohydrolase FolD [Bacteroidia bacterium]